MTARALRNAKDFGSDTALPPEPSSITVDNHSPKAPANAQSPNGQPDGSPAKPLKTHESEIWAGKKSPLAVGLALLAIHEEQLYLSEAPNFMAYVQKSLPIGRSQAFRWLAAARMYRSLRPVNGKLPENEAQFRVLAKLSLEQAQQAWEKAVGLAQGQRVSATHIRMAINELRGSKMETKAAPIPNNDEQPLSKLFQSIHLLRLTAELRLDEGPRQEFDRLLDKIDRVIEQLRS